MNLRYIRSITATPGGDVWLYDLEQGLFLWSLGVLKQVTLPAEFTVKSRAGAFLGVVSGADNNGRLWISVGNDTLAIVNPDGTYTMPAPTAGLTDESFGAIVTLHQDSRGQMWLGGSSGLGRFVNRKFTMVSRTNGFPAGRVTAIVEDKAGVLWFALNSGIARVDPVEFDKAARDNRYQIRYGLYTTADGVAGMPIPRGGRSAVRGSDGRLWFITSRGLTVIDPSRLSTPDVPSRVSVERVVADEAFVDPGSAAQLPPRTARLQIDYTLRSLASATKVRFRYRLEGFEERWIDAGTRRQAVYTNLAPRAYRFQVVAYNSDGTGSESNGEWYFTVKPAFYETRSFFMSCAVVVLAVTWTIWRFRVRRVRERLAMLLTERVRLSRDVHDTLLQGLVGTALQCAALAHNARMSPEALRSQLNRIRKQLEANIREARQAIWDLRASTFEINDLASSLREAARRAMEGQTIGLNVTLSGTARRCSRLTEEQLLRIGREAIVNAVRHARPKHVEVMLHYGDEVVRLRVIDDGCGFDRANLSPDENGHYGLIGMRERAETIGGEFKLVTAPGGGTQVDVTVAYSPVALTCHNLPC
jgi:signal transduction histidine kinase